MPYYPSSQIKPNIYTNGEEYVLATTKEKYKGYFYELSNGKKYTGKTPQDGPNILLIPFTASRTNNELIYDTPNNESYIAYDIPTAGNNYMAVEYIKLTKNTKPRILPTPNLTLPTQQNYDLGVFTRYFCKKNNENIYFEINNKTYALLNSRSPQVSWDLYSAVLTLWYLTGDKNTVAKANKGLVENIERTQKWYGFSQYFKNNFTQYYLAS